MDPKQLQRAKDFLEVYNINNEDFYFSIPGSSLSICLAELLVEFSSSQWISVEDSLPAHHLNVLCLGIDKSIENPENFTSVCAFGNDKKWHAVEHPALGCDFESWKGLEVTHWMPLPKLPNE